MAEEKEIKEEKNGKNDKESQNVQDAKKSDGNKYRWSLLNVTDTF